MSRKRLWFGIVVVVAAALAFAGPSIIAGMGNTAMAGGCGMDMRSCGRCGMMGGSAKPSGQMACQGCVMLSGKVTAVDARRGTATVQIGPSSNGGDAAKKLIGQAKVGDSLPLMVMTDKDGKPAACPMIGTSAVAAKYACPMHPEVTSDRPGRCPKCGMDLVKAGGEQN